MNHPENYIDIDTLKRPPKKTLRGDVSEIVARFGRQEFFAKHVVLALRKEMHYRIKNRTSLYSGVRKEVWCLAEEGRIELVSRGTPGKASVYRNIEQHLQENG